MNKAEQLRKCLEKARVELNRKGYKYVPGESKLMDCKPFEIAYQDCIENIFPDEPWWKVTNYWDIFDAMMGGLSDEEVIDEIIKHIDPAFLKEGLESAKVEDGHSYEEYMRKFGDSYNAGELWDFSEEDLKSGAVEVNPEITYWKIEVDGEPRYFEAVSECLHEEKLDEGTSNFPTRFPHGFPLLVFYTIEEVYDMMSNDSDYPEEAEFEDEDGNVDEDAYWEAREKFEQEYWDKIDCCILDESQIDELEDKLYDFNQETKRIAEDADVGEDGYQQYSDKLNLENVELKVEPGYYEAAYIDVDHEDYLDDIEDGEWKEAQIKRIKDFMQSLVEEFGLSEYEVSWGPASNGETGYRKVKKQEEKLTPKNEGYTLLGKEDKEILAYSNYNNAVKKAEELGLKLAEYGDVYGSNVSYAFWNKSGNRNDDEEVMCYYFFGKDGKPRTDVTETELNQIAKAFGIPERDIDDAEEAIAEESLKEGEENHEFRLRKSKNEYGEYVIKEYVNGKFREDGSYYTDDWEDAVGTLKSIAKDHGMVVIPVGSGYIARKEPEVKENMYDGKKGGNKGSVKTKVHVNKNAGNPKRNMEIFNHLMGSDGPAPSTSTGVCLGESGEGKVEFCLMSDGDNVDCYTSEEEAIKSAEEYYNELKNRKLKKNVRVLKVTYGPENEVGDSEEEDLENVWDSGDIDGYYFESLKEEKEYLSDKVTKVLDDYGILYGDIVENGDGTVNIVGVDEDEWDEVVEAIKAELGLDVLVPDVDHDEFDDELIVRECVNK